MFDIRLLSFSFGALGPGHSAKTLKKNHVFGGGFGTIRGTIQRYEFNPSPEIVLGGSLIKLVNLFFA